MKKVKIFFLLIMFALFSSASNGSYKKLAYDFDMLDKYTLGKNSFINWIKSLLKPDKSH